MLLYVITVWCIFSFKLLLIPIGESGIRIDDFLILIAFLMLLVRGDLSRIQLSAACKMYLFFIVVNFVSTLWNSLAGRVSPLYSTVFDIRLIQYLVFYFLGYALAKAHKEMSALITAYMVAMIALIPLQLSGVLPNVSKFSESRVSGNANGPYEFAGIAAFCLCYLGYENRRRFLGTVAIVFVILTASRATFVGVIVSLLRALIRFGRGSIQRTAVAAFTAVTLVAIVYGAFTLAASNTDSFVTGRVRKASSSITLDEVKVVYATAPVANQYMDYWSGIFAKACDFNACSDNNGDPSTLFRLYRWTSLIKSVNQHLDSILIGLGPSFGTEAVDGYYVRLYTETGLIGIVAFVLVIWKLWRAGDGEYWAFREYILILLFTAAFIDIFTSYRPMILMWLWHGASQYNREFNSSCADATT